MEKWRRLLVAARRLVTLRIANPGDGGRRTIAHAHTTRTFQITVKIFPNTDPPPSHTTDVGRRQCESRRSTAASARSARGARLAELQADSSLILAASELLDRRDFMGGWLVALSTAMQFPQQDQALDAEREQHQL